MQGLRATFYDLRGYFVPGAVILLLICELPGASDLVPHWQFFGDGTPLVRAALFAIIAYVVGHILNAIANFTIDRLPFGSYPPASYFKSPGGTGVSAFQADFPDATATALAAAIERVFGMEGRPQSERGQVAKAAYWPCFQFVLARQNTETENFLGLTGFYRAMTVAMFTIALAYGGVAIASRSWAYVVATASSVSIGLLFLARFARFGRYLAKTVYSNFLHLSNEHLARPSQGTPDAATGPSDST
jgi:hypothetical protein